MKPYRDDEALDRRIEARRERNENMLADLCEFYEVETRPQVLEQLGLW